MINIDDILGGSLHDEIKASYNKSSGGYLDNVLKFTPDKDCIVRLLPMKDDIGNSLYKVWYRGWRSYSKDSMGKYVEAIEPASRNEENPIAEYSKKLTEELKLRNLDKTHPDMVKARSLWSDYKTLVNCYVVDDKANPDNNGKVMVIQLPKTLASIIEDHLFGDRAVDYGTKIFDPTEAGHNLKIRCKRKEISSTSASKDMQKMGVEYTQSYFMSPSPLDGISDNKEKIIELLDSCHDLKTFFPIKTTQERQEMLDKHFICRDEGSDVDVNSMLDSVSDSSDIDESEETDNNEEPEETQVEVKEVKETVDNHKKKEPSDNNMSDIDEILAGLGK